MFSRFQRTNHHHNHHQKRGHHNIILPVFAHSPTHKFCRAEHTSLLHCARAENTQMFSCFYSLHFPPGKKARVYDACSMCGERIRVLEKNTALSTRNKKDVFRCLAYPGECKSYTENLYYIEPQI